MAFENAEIGAVAQIVALPGIAVEHHVADAGLAHGGHEALATFLREHGVIPRDVAASGMIIPAIQAVTPEGSNCRRNREEGYWTRCFPARHNRRNDKLRSPKRAFRMAWPRFAWPNVALAILVLGATLAWTVNAKAQT